MKKTLNLFIGELVAVGISIALILVLSCFVQLLTMGENAVIICNQIIKIIALFVGVCYFAKDEKGAIKGALFGILFSLLTNFLLSGIGGGLPELKSLLIDLCFCLIVGAIIGVISVNVRR